MFKLTRLWGGRHDVAGPGLERADVAGSGWQQQLSASDTVLSDVSNAFESVKSNEEVVQLYTSGYLKQAQDSRDISEYAYKRGAASLLDYLDSERSYRAVQLAYRQALAAYMTALEQLKEAEGTRNLP